MASQNCGIKPRIERVVNWLSKTIRRIARRKALERWKTKRRNSEVTTQVTSIWPIAKSFTMRNGPKAPTPIHDPLGLEFHPSEKVDAFSDCSENQFIPHDLCNNNHERRVAVTDQALLEAVGKPPPPHERM
jgi:hypothetical protein